jgi:hypothetical protein
MVSYFKEGTVFEESGSTDLKGILEVRGMK